MNINENKYSEVKNFDPYLSDFNGILRYEDKEEEKTEEIIAIPSEERVENWECCLLSLQSYVGNNPKKTVIVILEEWFSEFW